MRGRLLVWLPVLMVGSLIYWTLAFGLGGRSLMLLTQCEYGLDDPDGADKDSHQSITVNLSGVSSSGDEVKEATSVRVYLVPDHESAAADESGQGAHGGGSRRGPGDTAF